MRSDTSSLAPPSFDAQRPRGYTQAVTAPTCTRVLAFDAAHRVPRHESKCRNLHGHRYTLEVQCAGPLDDAGRVIDFGLIKSIVGGWVDEALDHTTILDAAADADLADWLDARGWGKPVYRVAFSPTAENLAAHILGVANTLLSAHGIRVTSVRLYETPNGWADARVSE